MRHPELDTILAYLDKGLPLNEQEALEKHLQICPDCRAEVGQAQRLDELTLSLIEDPALPHDFIRNLSVRLRQESGVPVQAKVIALPTDRSSWRMAVVGPLLAAAASLALLVGGLSVSTQNPAPSVAYTPAPPTIITAQSPITPIAEVTPGTSPLAVATPTISRNQAPLPGVAEEIRMAPGSDFHYLGQKGSVSEFELRRGRVWVKETQVKVAVTTPHGRVIPVGTEYEVFAGPRGSQVLVWEGTVQVEGRGSRLQVESGREVRIDSQGVVGTAAPMSPQRDRRACLSWQERFALSREDRPAPPRASATPRIPQPEYPIRLATPKQPAGNISTEPLPNWPLPQSWDPQGPLDGRDGNMHGPGWMPRRPGGPGMHRWERQDGHNPDPRPSPARREPGGIDRPGPYPGQQPGWNRPGNDYPGQGPGQPGGPRRGPGRGGDALRQRRPI